MSVRCGRQLELQPRTWGGCRAGAGRKPRVGRRAVPHRCWPTHVARCPVHVTLRACAGLGSLRRDRVFGGVRAALGRSSVGRFRLLQFSVQTDYLHLLIESDDPRGIRPGIRGLAIRVAKAINRTLGRRGRVWADRYHARLLATPREVRHALVYVLQNWRKHIPGVRGLDPRSSAMWFNGWRMGTAARVLAAPVVAAPTWLVRIGWRRHGLLRIEEAPRAPLRSPSLNRLKRQLCTS